MSGRHQSSSTAVVISTGKFLFRASWIVDYPDAENYLSLFYSNNFSPNGPNYTHFKMTNLIVIRTAFKETDDENVLFCIKMDKSLLKYTIILFYDKVA
jgi:peptide/nickel transport system substrate-binding protein